MYSNLLKRLLLCCVLLLGTGLYAEKKADVEVTDILKGSYIDYYPSDIKNKIISVGLIHYVDWVGKGYASKNDIDENSMLTRSEKNAKDYAIGYAGGYLSIDNNNYNPQDYYIIIDHFDVSYRESDYKLSTVITGNILLIKK